MNIQENIQQKFQKKWRIDYLKETYWMEYDERHLYHKYVLDDSFYNLNNQKYKRPYIHYRRKEYSFNFDLPPKTIN